MFRYGDCRRATLSACFSVSSNTRVAGVIDEITKNNGGLLAELRRAIHVPVDRPGDGQNHHSSGDNKAAEPALLRSRNSRQTSRIRVAFQSRKVRTQFRCTLAAQVDFPDLIFSVQEQFAEGDNVASRFEWTGTHQGTLGGPATGRFVRVWGIVIDRSEKGRIKDTRIIMDTLGLMIQLAVSLHPAPDLS